MSKNFFSKMFDSYAGDYHDVFVNMSIDIKGGKENLYDLMRQLIVFGKTRNSKSDKNVSIPDWHAFLDLLNVIADYFVFDVVQHANSQKNPKMQSKLVTEIDWNFINVRYLLACLVKCFL